MAQFTAPLSIASGLLSAGQSYTQQKVQRKQANANQNELKRQYERDLKKQRQAKKEATATARAKLAGQGRGVGDGSAAALINGLNKRVIESETELAQDYNAQRRRSLLQETSTQYNSLDQFFGANKSFRKFIK